MKKRNKVFIAVTSLVALAIPAIVGVAAAQPKTYFIPSASMKPTLPLNSHILVQRGAFRSIAQVRRGDIIVYNVLDKATRKPMESTKRVVGLPSDKVQLSGANIWINGRRLSHVLVRRIGKIAEYQETNDQATYHVQYGDYVVPAPAFSGVVPKGHLFCLGDNRDNALDSRYIGAVPFEVVIGKKCRSNLEASKEKPFEEICAVSSKGFFIERFSAVRHR